MLSRPDKMEQNNYNFVLSEKPMVMKQSAKLLLTGVTGFLGSLTAIQFLNKGYEVSSACGICPVPDQSGKLLPNIH
jgi:hypothetical protein